MSEATVWPNAFCVPVHRQAPRRFIFIKAVEKKKMLNYIYGKIL